MRGGVVGALGLADRLSRLIMPFAPASVVVEVAVSITGNFCRKPQQTLILYWLKPLRHELVAKVAVAEHIENHIGGHNMEKDSQSRKWQLTINNPDYHEVTHDTIKIAVGTMKSVIYWCMADEIGEGGTRHTHIFLAARSAIRFSTIKKLFPAAHIEMCKGTCQQNMEYVSKTGKWEKDRKHETCVDGTFEEFGEMPVERQGKRNDLDDLYDMIKSGMNDHDIINEDPAYMTLLDTIQKTRQLVVQEKFRETFRDLDVIYIWGDTGTGKTRSVMEGHGYSNVFRVTDYSHPFDAYSGQDVILFDEFRSSLLLADMLKYLDGYPLELPCRYLNKYACFTKVYIISNIPLAKQYTVAQMDNYETWLAFIRRIHTVKYFHEGMITTFDIILDKSGWHQALTNEVPFSTNS